MHLKKKRDAFEGTVFCLQLIEALDTKFMDSNMESNSNKSKDFST